MEESQNGLTLPVPSLLYPHLIPGREGGRPPCYIKNPWSYELEILQGIRDIFERLRNIKAVYLVFTWLP